MPNHIHGIIFIKNVGVQNFELLQSQQNKYQKIISRSLGSIVKGFKIGLTKWFRNHTELHQIWQRNYYEHVIRNDEDLNQIREYIIYNLLKWELDKENPNVKADFKSTNINP